MNIQKQGEKQHSELLSKVAEHRAVVGNLKNQTSNLGHEIKKNAMDTQERLDALSSTVDGTKTAVMSMRDIVQHVGHFVSTFPFEMRDLLQKILQANWQLYHLLLNIQQNPGQSPTGLLESNIHFEDAMGGWTSLPFEHFRHGEVNNLSSPSKPR